MTDIDKELCDKLHDICDENTYMKGILLYCESQKDREKLLAYINAGHDGRKEVLLMASQIGIESGNWFLSFCKECCRFMFFYLSRVDSFCA